MNILVADDDLTSRTIISAILARTGYEVVEASDGVEAWEILMGPGSPKLVILDWMMPGMDGMEVLKRVRRVATDQPAYIIMLTAKGRKSDIIAGLEAGANDYLSKPFDGEELRARVEVGRRMVELQAALVAKVEELRKAYDQIKTLRGIVPICASCKKIRDDAGYWQQVETYVSSHTEAEFSHGICPECMKKLYGEFAR